jgi:hypothetical protein
MKTANCSLALRLASCRQDFSRRRKTMKTTTLLSLLAFVLTFVTTSTAFAADELPEFTSAVSDAGYDAFNGISRKGPYPIGCNF